MPGPCDVFFFVGGGGGGGGEGGVLPVTWGLPKGIMLRMPSGFSIYEPSRRLAHPLALPRGTPSAIGRQWEFAILLSSLFHILSRLFAACILDATTGNWPRTACTNGSPPRSVCGSCSATLFGFLATHTHPFVQPYFPL